MKTLSSLLILFFLIFASTVYSQRTIATNGCLKMYGNAQITNKGMYYYAYLANECSKPIYVGQSKYTAKFIYLNSDGAERKKTKNLRFPRAFLAPGTVMEKDRNRNDSDSKTYTNVYSQYGTLGSAVEGKTGLPVSGAMKIKANSSTYIGSIDNVDFYVITTSGYSGYSGFKKFGLKLIAKNKDGYKKKINAYLNYTIYAHGKAFPGDINIKVIRPNDTKSKSEKEPVHFNFTPEIYIKITSTNISTSGGGTSTAVATNDGGGGSSNTGVSNNASSTRKITYKSYALPNGAKFSYSHSSEEGVIDMASLISPNGDTLMRDIPGISTENGLYVFDPDLPKWLAENISALKGDIISFIHDDVKNRYGKDYAVYNTKTNKIEPYEYFKPTVIDGKAYTLSQKTTANTFKLTEYSNGNVLTEFSYKKMEIVENEPSSITNLFFTAKKSTGYWGAVNAFNQVKCEFKYSEISSKPNDEGNYKVYKSNGSKWKVKRWQGVVNNIFTEVIPCKYDYIETAESGYYTVFNKVSVNSAKGTKTDFGTAYPMQSYQVAVFSSAGKQMTDFGRLKWIQHTEKNSAHTFSVNKKDFKVIAGIEVLINSKGSVFNIAPDGIDASLFVDDRACKKFTDIKELQLFAE